jgi:hypothetical protein
MLAAIKRKIIEATEQWQKVIVVLERDSTSEEGK